MTSGKRWRKIENVYISAAFGSVVETENHSQLEEAAERRKASDF